ncbi:MAG TPA: TIGR03016 family PEP-CTERM system-associated outer membrane protein [Burkholderiaceae bacterium]|nr:TIGR03016 family PEP-CTERM system-associated outer membrane protein [Burkholderiaceae bacterium]
MRSGADRIPSVLAGRRSVRGRCTRSLPPTLLALAVAATACPAAAQSGPLGEAAGVAGGGTGLAVSGTPDRSFGLAGRQPQFTASIGGNATLTNNSNLSSNATKESDLILSVSPSIGVNYQGGRLSLNGNVGLTALYYVNGTQDNSIFPAIALAGTYEAIDNFLFIDGYVNGNTQFISPFGPQVEGQNTSNTYTAYNYNLAPYIRGRAWGDVEYFARSDSTWSNSTQDGFENTYLWAVQASLTRGPRPWGWSLLYNMNRWDGGSRQTFDNNVARLVLTYLVNESLTISARGGYESQSGTLLSSTDVIYGGGLTYRPSPRTDLNGYWEKRFFGDSWNASFTHRLPRTSMSLLTSRDISFTTNSLFTVPGTSNVFTSVDALLATRIPNADARAIAARELISRNGLPDTLTSPVQVYTDQLTVQTNYSGILVWSGARNSAALNGFYLRTQGITATGVALPGLLTGINTVQRGGSVSFSHRLDPLTSLSAVALLQDTVGFAGSAGQFTRTYTYRLQASRQFAPKLSAYAGARYVASDSNVDNAYNEAAIFAGATYVF